MAGQSEEELSEKLRAAFLAELEHTKTPRLQRRAEPLVVRRHVESFLLWREHLENGMTVLDWGCGHAPDAWLVRQTLGDNVRLLGTDLEWASTHVSLHDKIGLDFTVADHPSTLPYEDASIDLAVGAGVLEHVVHPGASLMELHRVLRPGGLLVLTFLPNRHSWAEFAHRIRRSPRAHRRRYASSGAHRYLLDHGFIPRASGHHQFLPAHGGGAVAARLWPLNQHLEKAPPSRWFSANIWLVAQRADAI